MSPFVFLMRVAGGKVQHILSKRSANALRDVQVQRCDQTVEWNSSEVERASLMRS